MFSQGSPSTEGEVLRRCHEHAASGRYKVSQAAVSRSQAAGLSPADIRQILATAESCSSGATSGTWLVRGRTIDGAEGEATVTFDASGLTVL
jgi:hypothetical protein